MTSITKSRLASAVACIPILWLSLAFVVLLAISAQASYSRWEHVSVQSVEGLRYDDVTVYLSNSTDRLVVEHTNGTQTAMEFSEFVAIYDARGRDVTELVLDPTYVKPEPVLPDPTDAPDTTPLLLDPDYRARSCISIQAGASATTGEWFTNRYGLLAFQAAVRVQTFRRFYVGMVYTHQIMDPGKDLEAWWSQDKDTVLLRNYTQHEIYAMIGVNSGPRHARQTFFYAELGGGTVSFADVTSSGYKAATWADFGARAAAGLIKPVSPETGLIFELNWRINGRWSDDSDGSRLGQLFGASIGLVFMAGK